MTDEQINVAIAEACGLKKPCRTVKLNSKGFFVTKHAELPDYCADLNAMHEAESKLKRSDQMNMHAELINVLNRLPKYVPAWRANARQRAEAFLRTLVKWEEEQG